MTRSGKRKFVRKTKQRVGCQDCGKEGPMKRLHFHHLDRESKVNEVSNMVKENEYTLDNVKNEIKKCKIVCMSCHALIHNPSHTSDDCIDALEYVAEKLGKSPTFSEYCENRSDTDASPSTILDIFGSWNDAKQATNLSTINIRHTRDDCIDGLEYVSEKLNKSPTFREYREHGRDTDPSTNAITNCFESWNDAKKAADLKTVSEDISKRETSLEPDFESGLVIEGQSELGSF